jgi:hypothetical protein
MFKVTVVHLPKALAQDIMVALRMIPLWNPNNPTAILRFVKEEDDLLLFSHREFGHEQLVFMFVGDGLIWTNDMTGHVERVHEKADFFFMLSETYLPVYNARELHFVRIHFRRTLRERLQEAQRRAVR